MNRIITNLGKTQLRSMRLGQLVGVLLIATLFLPAGLFAQQKLGVIDVERILRDSTRGKQVLEGLQSFSEQKKSELLAEQAVLEDLQKKFADSRLTLAEDKLADMQKELEDKTIGLRRMQDDAERELQKRQQQEFGKIEEEVLPIINTVGKELGYTLIFNKFQSGLVFADDGVDLTDLVIERYNGGGGSPSGD